MQQTLFIRALKMATILHAYTHTHTHATEFHIRIGHKMDINITPLVGALIEITVQTENLQITHILSCGQSVAQFDNASGIMFFLNLKRETILKICWLCLVLINSVLLNLLCVWILLLELVSH